MTPPPPLPPMDTAIALTTTDLYNTWSTTYDHDSNVLQALDTLAFLPSIAPYLPFTPITLLDLGCGTGRNALVLTEHLPQGSRIIAADASSGMLEVAKMRVTSSMVEWQQGDLKGGLQLGGKMVDAVVSTLVLEHVELSEFFRVVAGAVKKGGWVWVTNMHPEMGESRAGFKGEDGVKRVGVSWNYGVSETVEMAGQSGLGILGEPVVMGIEEGDVDRLGERARKWAGKMLVGYMFQKS